MGGFGRRYGRSQPMSPPGAGDVPVQPHGGVQNLAHATSPSVGSSTSKDSAPTTDSSLEPEAGRAVSGPPGGRPAGCRVEKVGSAPLTSWRPPEAVPRAPETAVGDSRSPRWRHDMDPARITEILTDPVTLDLVERQPIMQIAYSALDGGPRAVPIGYLLREGRFLFFTIPGSDKVAALYYDPRIALTIDVYPPPVPPARPGNGRAGRGAGSPRRVPGSIVPDDARRSARRVRGAGARARPLDGAHRGHPDSKDETESRTHNHCFRHRQEEARPRLRSPRPGQAARSARRALPRRCDRKRPACSLR